MHRQSKTNDKRRLADLGVLLLLASLVGLYCFDAIRASTDILNLILVLPITAILLALCLAQFVVSLRSPQQVVTEEEPVAEIAPVVGLFVAYVVSLHWLGFDVGTCLFLLVFLWLQGERRRLWLLGYSVGFAFSLSLFFSKMLPYPMPMLVLDTQY